MGFEAPHLSRIALSLGDYLRDLEVETHSGPSAVEAYDYFVLIERLAVAGKAAMARRVDETNAWRESGARNASDFLAKRAGVSATSVGKDLATARRLEELPNVKAAFMSGRADKNQLVTFAKRAEDNPQADAEFAKMLASGPSASELQEKLAKINKPKTSEKDLKDKETKAKSKRYAKFEIDPEDTTMFRGIISGPVADLALLKTRVKPLHDTKFQANKKSGVREKFAAVEYDAFVELIETGGSNKPVKSKNKGIIRVANNGRCEIVGVGEVTTAIALKYASEKHFKVLDVDAETQGNPEKPRSYPASLITALMARDPSCKVPGCTATVCLEHEHRLPVDEGGESQLHNMWECCTDHHYMKTHKGWCLTGDLESGDVKWEKRREKGDGGSGYSLVEDRKQQEQNKKPEAS